MPLVTVSGLPCAGKSTRALQLKKYISAHSPNTHYPIVIINEDDMLQTHKSVVYGCVEEEKRVRAALLSAVERHLTRDTIVICDAMNYIKGFRYQLYCIARNLNTQSCVVNEKIHTLARRFRDEGACMARTPHSH